MWFSIRMIPVVDLFAGAGGLGEGFAALHSGGVKRFQVKLSVENNQHAHQTLELRSFYRQFSHESLPDSYYQLAKGLITKQELFEAHPNEASVARNETWMHELGTSSEWDQSLDERLRCALRGAAQWVLVGGPPCQAYSVAGRARNSRPTYVAAEDNRHFLYREYLQILTRHHPSVFVMENVKGVLSSKVDGESIFHRMLEDLTDPAGAVGVSDEVGRRDHRYVVYSLVEPSNIDMFGVPTNSTADFIIECEKYGIPQARHRVILLGVRDDLGIVPRLLKPADGPVNTTDVLSGLPRLRSKLSLTSQGKGWSRADDSPAAWLMATKAISSGGLLCAIRERAGEDVAILVKQTADSLTVPPHDSGGEFVKFDTDVGYRPDWYLDNRLGGVVHSSTRAHIRQDLHRYLYAACFAQIHQRTPRLSDFPEVLYPEHRNVAKSLSHDNFSDRFRVQLAGQPSTTVVSHISKDGHYYIHYDASQCRSLTAREAARLQTFPDDFIFCGNRTLQYNQIGNAVPPLLALQIAEIVKELLESASGVKVENARQAYA